MKPSGLLPVGFLDLLFGRGSRDVEDVVKVGGGRGGGDEGEGEEEKKGEEPVEGRGL